MNNKKGQGIALEKLLKIILGLLILWVIYYVIKNIILAGDTFLSMFG